MVYDKDQIYWEERTKKFGKTSVGYCCNERLMYWDNILRAQAISRLVQIKPGMKVLDAGTGTGYWAIKYAGKGAEVVGLDFNKDLLQMAANNAQQSGVQIKWLHNSLEDVSLPSDFFDIVFSITCIQHITDKERQINAIQQILKSLKSEGIFVLIEDTIVSDHNTSDYILTYTQHGWIDLVQSQGAQILDFIGVSFLRFKYKLLPVLLYVGIDYILSRFRLFRSKACVTAFSFIIRK